MKTKILNKLKQIEQEKGIKILFAVESGSRAWGFASPDSDWDIRFVYVHEKNWYLNLWKKKDTIQFMTEDLLDGSGWDLKKALKLMAKSNASFLGWLDSPIIYMGANNLLQMKNLAIKNHNPVSIFHHYHNMSKKFNDLKTEEEINLKSLFYALRTALCAKWVIEKKSIPPTQFQDLLILVGESYKTQIQELLEIKRKFGEKYFKKINSSFLLSLKTIIDENEVKKDLIKHKNVNYDDFNAFFIKNLK